MNSRESQKRYKRGKDQDEPEFEDQEFANAFTSFQFPIAQDDIDALRPLSVEWKENERKFDEDGVQNPPEFEDQEFADVFTSFEFPIAQDDIDSLQIRSKKSMFESHGFFSTPEPNYVVRQHEKTFAYWLDQLNKLSNADFEEFLRQAMSQPNTSVTEMLLAQAMDQREQLSKLRGPK